MAILPKDELQAVRAFFFALEKKGGTL